MTKIRVATCAHCGRQIEFVETVPDVDYSYPYPDSPPIPFETERDIWRHRESEQLICPGSKGATGAYPDKKTIHEIYDSCRTCEGNGFITDDETGEDHDCGICHGTGDDRN
jgi:hypothetical protein